MVTGPRRGFANAGSTRRQTDHGTMMSKHPIRILLAKIGLDGHDRGVKVLARSFRDAGFDVIYTGLWQTAQATMYAAMQEDVDLVGVSLLSAAHLTVMPEVLRHRADLGIERMPVMLGGIIPEADHPRLREMGVAAVFNPGSAVEAIIHAARDLARRNTRVSLPQA
jgi:methylmalonyl-CoA mutase C-terminal domain/subunit